MSDRKITNDEYIGKLKEKHGDKYDYSLTEYCKTNIKIKIICPIHGEFLQSYRHHSNGQGCKKCSYISRKITKTKSFDDFLLKATILHSDLSAVHGVTE